MTGHINWYDHHSKRGCIIGSDNVWYRIHEFVLFENEFQLDSKVKVEFTLANTSVYPIIKTIKGV